MKILFGNRLPIYKTIKEIAEDPAPDWVTVFKQAQDELNHASTVIHSISVQTGFFPRTHELFAAFDKCPFPPSVVIIGQDPYHSVENNEPQACGMCFATRRGCSVQPSLRNIYAELKKEYSDFVVPNHGDLSEWANQGVLLLNTCLTVAPHAAGSHMKGIKGALSDVNPWSGFIERVLNAIALANPECIYLLWGAEAQKLVPSLSQHSVKLIASHPSPFSAHRSTKDAPAFMDCQHFSTVNNILISKGKPAINWQISV